MKMNKYNEALNHIINCDREDGGISYLSDAYRNDISALQELVDRATPKKVIFENNGEELLCPNCYIDLMGSINDPDHETYYCFECGQALDWSDEE